MSPYHFCRQFGRLYGLTPHRYQQVMRLTKARGMIVGGASLAEAAAATGFADQSHLTRHFSARFGLTPGRWEPKTIGAKYDTLADRESCEEILAAKSSEAAAAAAELAAKTQAEKDAAVKQKEDARLAKEAERTALAQ